MSPAGQNRREHCSSRESQQFFQCECDVYVPRCRRVARVPAGWLCPPGFFVAVLRRSSTLPWQRVAERIRQVAGFLSGKQQHLNQAGSRIARRWSMNPVGRAVRITPCCDRPRGCARPRATSLLGVAAPARLKTATGDQGGPPTARAVSTVGQCCPVPSSRSCRGRGSMSSVSPR